MTELGFEVLDVRPQEHAASPHLLFRLRVTESSGEAVHAIALRCQLRIEQFFADLRATSRPAHG